MTNNSFRSVCIAALLLAGGAAHASRTIHETHEAGPRATVDINGVSGTFDVSGWDKPSVEVFGTVGEDVERVDVSGDSNHISVQVVTRTVRLWGMDGNVHLSVRVPAAASVSTTVVSADLHTTGLSGEVELHTVSGNVTGEVGGNLRAKTVSGAVRLKAPAAKSLRISTVSGDIQASGGDGESDVTTVSGNADLSLGTQSRSHFKSVSGDFTVALGLTPDAQVDGEAVSGNVKLNLHGAAAADYDVETHSGSIHNCFGPKPEEPRYGPGSRLMFKNGDSSARVHVVTHSGDVRLCKSE
jgi:DUF4097 and DUF4098 domain-containing protein YvlB